MLQASVRAAIVALALLLSLRAGLLGLRALVGGGLLGGGYAGVEDDHNAELRNAEATQQPVPLGGI